ncbi:manganese efflux pump [Paludibacter sp. 221]|uniref:manganese efflux pump MntP n=1 Tax=Paludibacter sp. 221 TaxID=2302939 RepID=UPI0013D2968E|nr:manganese efflux pump MntP family protein [Paludibacter sp. 221]NDV46720.1 manganese efflux pump [Paludibacter sp. 221]
MDLLTIILMAIGLAMDCFAVSISKGICTKRFHFGYALRIAFLFGLFQGVMPLIGYYISSVFAEQIKAFDHWIAFVLLGFIGVRMIMEAFKKDEDCCDGPDTVKKHFRWKGLITLAIATSIDALATGVVLAPFAEWIYVAVIIIALVSFLFSFVGVFIGTYFGKKFTFKVEVLGGIILVGIGAKILIEHLFF